jgi:ribonuclease HII
VASIDTPATSGERVTNLVLGIDEAGRGPALGAMVLAAVALTPAASRRLSRAGVADSKSFGAGPEAHQARVALAGAIEKVATFIAIEICDVETIDAYVARGALNILERERAERMIARAPACKRIIADGRRLFSALRATFPHLEAMDRAEEHHVAVAAASICAKVRRDELFACIAARYEHEFGPVGGQGYTNAATRTFTRAYVRKHGVLPPEARFSWPWPRHGAVKGHRVAFEIGPAAVGAARPGSPALAGRAEKGRARAVDAAANRRPAPSAR